jgi:hypothetical protein
MSSISSLSSAPSALSALTAHTHGHKKGAKVQSADDSSSDGMTPVPAGTQQNLFSSMLQSLEQATGVQPATGTPSTATPSASSAATTASPTVAAASTAGAGTVTTQSANTALQKYIHNVSQNPQANGSQLSKLAGSNVSVSA